LPIYAKQKRIKGISAECRGRFILCSAYVMNAGVWCTELAPVDWQGRFLCITYVTVLGKLLYLLVYFLPFYD
jgi:hypothetical protein